MPEPAEQVISRVLESGEKILWTGRPHVEISLNDHARRRRRGMMVGIAALLLATPWLLSRTVFSSFSEIPGSVLFEPRFVVPAVAVLLVIILPKMFKVDPQSRLDRYFNSLTYAITTERLLILEGNEIYDAYTPEQARQPIVRERVPGYSDVLLEQRSQTGVDGTRNKSRDPIFKERRHAGFKALPNAQEIKQRIEDWIQDHHQQAAREVSDFVEATPEQKTTDEPTGGSRIVNSTLGLELSAPEEWKVRARMKKKPQGKIFLDKEDWQERGGDDSWNLVRIDGPSRCRVEVEVFETKPTVTFEKLAHNKLADSMAGPVVDTEPNCTINGLRGFTVTRRSETISDRQAEGAGSAAIVAPERHTVLYDGGRQIYIISAWPEDSDDLKRAVDAVVESIQLT